MRLTKSKPFLCLICLMILLGTLTACGGQSESSPPPAEDSPPQEAAQTDNTPTATAVPPTSTPVPPTATPIPPSPTPAPTDTPPADSTPDPGEDTAGTATLPGLPLPEDAQDVTYGSSDITFTSPSDPETVVEFYRQLLSADNWEEPADFSQVDQSSAFVQFERGEETIFITVFNFDGASEATIDLSSAPSLAGSTDTGENDTTMTAAADGSGYTIADWPTPPEAKEINISGDTLSFKVSLPLADLAEFYRPTYDTMGLDTGCLDDTADYTSLSCSVSTGDITLNFFAFEGFEDTEVEINFVNYALGSATDSSDGSSGELGVTDQDGLPLPDDYTGYTSEGSEFSRQVNLTSPSDLDTLLEFFQTELANRGWTLADSDQTSTEATLRFSGPEGELVVTLQAGDETQVTLTVKNADAAKEAGILPPTGQARVYLVNLSDKELTVTLNDQVINIAAGAGQESPDDAPNLDLPPGTYTVKTEVGGSSVTDEVTIGPDESWGLLLDEQGALPLQMY